MTPEEKIERLRIALINTMASLQAVRNFVESTTRARSQNYQRLMLLVDLHCLDAQEILRLTEPERK